MFDARDNFVPSAFEQLTDEHGDEEYAGSVFISGTEDYFDPGSFLTRESPGQPEPETALPPEPEREPDREPPPVREHFFPASLDQEDDDKANLTPADLDSLDSLTDPLELEAVQPDRTPLSRRLAMAAAVVVLTLTLPLQYFWFNLPQLSQNASLRPWYETVCNLTGCTPPAQRRLNAIQSDNLVVRSHPTVSGALEVMFVFRNEAGFEQPFPVVQLQFTDRDNQLVASRNFTPQEYLDPALRQLTMMPAGSPVQISLDIVDPGDDAINYALAFRFR
ncbi:MAG: DUF3426 domain-containing protein [Pseudohongiellaceae bacterium]